MTARQKKTTALPTGAALDDSDLDIMHKEELQALRTSFAEKALRIVREILPTKVLALNATLESKQMSMDLSEVHVPIKLSTDAHPTGDASESARKKRKLDEDSSVDHQVDLLSNKYTAKSKELLPSNQTIVDIMNIMKPNVLDFIEHLNTVKIWIQLNIPRIEDGNNFGVSIQEETLNELGRAEDAAFGSLDNMSKYFVTRAKLLSKVIKYPGVQDYRQSVDELDEKFYIDLRMTCKELRNNYAILHDMIIKNFEKIRKPRSDHTHNLY